MQVQRQRQEGSGRLGATLHLVKLSLFFSKLIQLLKDYKELY
jgi:hypothetical protein